MANDGEDGNGLWSGFLKKRQYVSFLKGQAWIESRLIFFKNDAMWMFFKNLLLII